MFSLLWYWMNICIYISKYKSTPLSADKFKIYTEYLGCFELQFWEHKLGDRPLIFTSDASLEAIGSVDSLSTVLC